MQIRWKLVALLLWVISIPTFAQRAKTAGFVRLEPIHQVLDGHDEFGYAIWPDAWPLIVDPKNEAERHINSTLNSFNTESRKLASECHGGDDWSRGITVTMAGPHYLSLQASGRIMCGGPRPDPYDAALVFDLATGELLDGTTIVRKKSEIKVVKATKISRYPQSDKFLLSSPALDDMLMASANDNCKESLREVEHDPNLYGQILYSVWPDAKKNQVVVKPISLSYLDYLMCSEEIDIPLAQARKLGFTKSFLQAIDEAHRVVLHP